MQNQEKMTCVKHFVFCIIPIGKVLEILGFGFEKRNTVFSRVCQNNFTGAILIKVHNPKNGVLPAMKRYY